MGDTCIEFHKYPRKTSISDIILTFPAIASHISQSALNIFPTEHYLVRLIIRCDSIVITSILPSSSLHKGKMKGGWM